MSDIYDNIRDPDLLGSIIGARVADITQNDKDEKPHAVYFHFDNGYTVRFTVDDEGFDIRPPREKGDPIE